MHKIGVLPHGDATHGGVAHSTAQVGHGEMGDIEAAGATSGGEGVLPGEFWVAGGEI